MFDIHQLPFNVYYVLIDKWCMTIKGDPMVSIKCLSCVGSITTTFCVRHHFSINTQYYVQTRKTLSLTKHTHAHKQKILHSPLLLLLQPESPWCGNISFLVYIFLCCWTSSLFFHHIFFVCYFFTSCLFLPSTARTRMCVSSS